MKKTKVGQDTIKGLQEAIAWKQGKINLRTEHVELPAAPPDLDGQAVRRIRELLQVSQPVLAKYLGVSDKAVKAWEQDISQPNGSATRLLQIAADRPSEFRKIIVNASKKGA